MNGGGGDDPNSNSSITYRLDISLCWSSLSLRQLHTQNEKAAHRGRKISNFIQSRERRDSSNLINIAPIVIGEKSFSDFFHLVWQLENAVKFQEVRLDGQHHLTIFNFISQLQAKIKVSLMPEMNCSSQGRSLSRTNTEILLPRCFLKSLHYPSPDLWGAYKSFVLELVGCVLVKESEREERIVHRACSSRIVNAQ